MGNQPLAISPSKTPERSDSTSTLIREWLFRFGVNFEKDVAPVLPLWLESFGEMDPATLVPLFKRALKTCKFFPKVADILEPLNAVEQSNCEDEWQSLLRYCREWVHPDIHFRGAPELPVEIEHAARAAGGVHFLRSCSQEELGWRKKAFIEDLQRSRKTGDLAGLLTGGELRKLLRKAMAPVALLPDSRASVEPTGETRAGMAGPRGGKRQVLDIQARQAELQRQAEIIRAKYANPQSETEATGDA